LFITPKEIQMFYFASGAPCRRYVEVVNSDKIAISHGTIVFFKHWLLVL
jgi:hypothetical protein